MNKPMQTPMHRCGERGIYTSWCVGNCTRRRYKYCVRIRSGEHEKWFMTTMNLTNGVVICNIGGNLGNCGTGHSETTSNGDFALLEPLSQFVEEAKQCIGRFLCWVRLDLWYNTVDSSKAIFFNSWFYLRSTGTPANELAGGATNVHLCTYDYWNGNLNLAQSCLTFCRRIRN